MPGSVQSRRSACRSLSSGIRVSGQPETAVDPGSAAGIDPNATDAASSPTNTWCAAS
ncbi:hypothetical protein ABZ341_38530 [Streptomyces sp. NPDC006173]|uniref:hypothetical protein n=1 Tax=Streptomyces sp. NPDC006173 TaxID=3155349 RepID=UPI0033F615DE